jgi:hypothetical protein
MLRKLAFEVSAESPERAEEELERISQILSKALRDAQVGKEEWECIFDAIVKESSTVWLGRRKFEPMEIPQSGEEETLYWPYRGVEK